MPSLNEMYERYGCNKGDFVFIMDGMNVYHEKLEHVYKDSLGCKFPLLAVDDNDSLYLLKKDFPGGAPQYALISPSKEILYAGREKKQFFAAVEAVGLDENPALCDDSEEVTLFTPVHEAFYPMQVSITAGGRIELDVKRGQEYKVRIFAPSGKILFEGSSQFYQLGKHFVDVSLASGAYLMKVNSASGEMVKCVEISF